MRLDKLIVYNRRWIVVYNKRWIVVYNKQWIVVYNKQWIVVYNKRRIVVYNKQWIVVFLETLGAQACYLQALGEADEVRADTKGRTLARRNTHARADHIQDREDDRRKDGEGRDLIHGDGATGDQQCRGRDKETLNKILDDAIDDFSNTSVHYIF